MAEVFFRAKAEADLDAIMAFSIAEFGNDVARRYLDSLDEAWTLLGRYPEIGTAFGKRGRRAIRTYPCRSHRIFYTVEGDRVWILRILHQSMNHDRIMRAAMR